MSDRQVEDSVLALLAGDIDFHTTYGDSIGGEFFSDDIRKELFVIIRSYFRDCQSKLTIKQWREVVGLHKWLVDEQHHRKQVDLLFHKITVLNPDPQQGGYFFGKLRLEAKTRRLYDLLTQGFEALRQGDIETAERVFQEHVGVTNQTSNYALVDYREHLVERVKAMEAPEEEKTKGIIHTGIKPLDKVLRFKKGNLMLFASKTGGGKSIGLQDVAVYNACAGVNTVLVTNEMTVEETAFRCDSRLTEISHARFNELALSNLEKRRWKRMVEEVQSETFHILEMPEHCTTGGAFAILDEHKIKPDLVVFDYANKMKANFQTGQGWIDHGEVISDMRSASIKRRCGIISAVQIVAEAFNQSKLSMEDLAFAKVQISMHVDFLIGIIQTAKMKKARRARLHWMKGRQGVAEEFIEIAPDFDVVRLHSETQLQQIIIDGGK